MTTITKEATEEVRVREPTAFVWTNSLYDAFDAIQGKKSLPHFGDLIMVWRALHEAALPKSALVAPQAEGRDTGLQEALIEAAMGMPEPSPVYYRTPEALACAITLHDARAALKASYSGRTPQEILMAHIRATFPLAVKAGLHVGIKVTEARALSTKETE